jgi:hypothetical protein
MATSRACDLKACLGVGKSFDSGREDGCDGQTEREVRASFHCPLTGIGNHLLSRTVAGQRTATFRETVAGPQEPQRWKRRSTPEPFSDP